MGEEKTSVVVSNKRQLVVVTEAEHGVGPIGMINCLVSGKKT